MMFLVHAAHRVIYNGNLWDLQGYYYTLIPKSQGNIRFFVILSAIIVSAFADNNEIISVITNNQTLARLLLKQHPRHSVLHASIR